MSDLINRQAAIDALGEKPVGDTDWDLGCRNQWEWDTEILRTLPSTEPERKWIPVTEALPKNYERTICIDSRGAMMIGMYGEYGWTFPCYMTEPVAWMPMPEPWRGDR